MLKRLEDRDKPHPLPPRQFDIILADIPWKRLSSSSLLSLEEIINTKVPAAKDAILFMWANPLTYIQALEVMQAWGFNYRTGSVWLKLRIEDYSPYAKDMCESLLLGIKGKGIGTPYEPYRRPSVFENEERKDVYDVLESMWPNRTYLELFGIGSKGRRGWTTITTTATTTSSIGSTTSIVTTFSATVEAAVK